jgi:hypothetical protein
MGDSNFEEFSILEFLLNEFSMREFSKREPDDPSKLSSHHVDLEDNYKKLLLLKEFSTREFPKREIEDLPTPILLLHR